MLFGRTFLLCGIFCLALSGCTYQGKTPVTQPPRQQPTQPVQPVITERDVGQINQDDVPGTSAPAALPSSGQQTRPSITQPPVTISAAQARSRVAAYDQKLARWRVLDEQSMVQTLDPQESELMINCFRDLQNISAGYGTIAAQPSSVINDSAPDSQVIVDLLARDIAFVDGECGALLAGKAVSLPGQPQEVEQTIDVELIEASILALAEASEYDRIVGEYEQLASYQQEALGVEVLTAYARALVHQERFGEAAAQYELVIDALSQDDAVPFRGIALKKMIADLYAADGDYFSALPYYRQIMLDYEALAEVAQWAQTNTTVLAQPASQASEEYGTLLQAYVAYQPARDGYQTAWKAEGFQQAHPLSPAAPNAAAIAREVNERADLWFAQLLSDADELAEAGSYQEGLELLTMVPDGKITAEKLQLLLQKIDDITLAESIQRESLKVRQKEESRRLWDEAELLAQKGEYQAAVATYSQLRNSEYGIQAELKISELSLAAATAERRRAAELFVSYTRATDPMVQKDLLVQSRRVLKDILIDYPDAEIGDKVRGNISRVEAEMNKVDPSLLPALERAERIQAERADGAERAEQRDGEQIMAPEDIFDTPLPATQQSQAPQPDQTAPKPLPVLINQ
jgi:hypothetical protein